MHEALLTAPRSDYRAPVPCSPQLIRSHLIVQVPENYFYVPDLGQVPEIDVPSYLPDLPGIADDLMYSADLGPGIAPSAPGTIPELPTFHTEVAEPFKPGELETGVGQELLGSDTCILGTSHFPTFPLQTRKMEC